MKRLFAALRIAACLVLAAPSFGHAATNLKPGDRVVFYGDSITEQRIYTRYIEQFVYCRYPELKVRFFNAGWSGDTAGGALSRLDRDVLSLKPTVVTLFFGMNDGGYRPFADDIGANYKKNLEGIIKKLQANNVRVIVFTPGCVDPDRNPDRLGKSNYNANLEALGKIGADLAKQYNCPFVDVHQPMLDYQTAQKAKTPSFTMIPDGVHPDASGHYVMANAMLRAFGVEPFPPLATVDVKAKTATGASLTASSQTSATFALTPTTVPYWVDNNYASVVTQSGLADLVGQTLTVRGLDPGTYQVTAGRLSLAVTADALAAGIPVLGTYSDAGQKIFNLANANEQWYYSAWREYRLGYQDAPGTSDVVNGMMSTLDGLAAMIYGETPSASAVTFTVAQRPSGANLALNMKYDCSDPNGYNWGIGGLTDGSWEATQAHCFASGDKNAFPKTATIDLQQPAKIASVLLGTPAFGATKTIQVSVSADGTTYTPVGEHLFAQKADGKFTYAFPPTLARYVRLTYPDHYDDGNGYSPNFVFTNEVEVYAPGK